MLDLWLFICMYLLPFEIMRDNFFSSTAVFMVSEPGCSQFGNMVKTTFTGERSVTMAGTASESDPVNTVHSNGFDHTYLQLTIQKLNGKNYLEWAPSVKLMIDGRGCLDHLTGKIKKPADDDPSLKTWRSENSLVIAWLVNLMEPAIRKTCLFLPTAKAIWESVRDTYSDVWRTHHRFLN